ncbi:MAG: 5-formyltetrahydrofolate cyclo-ligase [Gammaproteobacteria bacterium]|nr:5-formyltetrahydrofolate cyclo-ligase [Gammaproteobacteria bacterium]
MSSINTIRQSIRQQRAKLNRRQRQRAARQLARHVITHPLFLRSQHIAAYLPINGEMDLQWILQRAWAMGKTIYLPLLTNIQDKQLWFAPYYPGDRLEMNQYGIMEPRHRIKQHIHLQRLDLVLTPLVACDLQGTRVGMGGGYYDRSFSFLARNNHWQHPKLLGMAYSFQVVKKLKRREWDIPLHGIATEQEIRYPL